MDIYKQTQLEKWRGGGGTAAPSAKPCAQKFVQCVLSAGFVFSLENSPGNTLCCPGTWNVRGSPAARGLHRKRRSEVTLGLNATEPANTGTWPSGFSAGLQSFLLTGTGVRKIPGLIEEFSSFPANKISFRTTGTKAMRFPFSCKPGAVPASPSLRGDPAP